MTPFFMYELWHENCVSPIISICHNYFGIISSKKKSTSMYHPKISLMFNFHPNISSMYMWQDIPPCHSYVKWGYFKNILFQSIKYSKLFVPIHKFTFTYLLHDVMLVYIVNQLSNKLICVLQVNYPMIYALL